MARLSDVRKVFRQVGVMPFLWRVVDESLEDNLLVWASALAYSWLFAIFPFFIFLLALLPHLPEPYGHIRQEIRRVTAAQLPAAADTMIWKALDASGNRLLNGAGLHGKMLYLSLGIALFAASSGTSMTMSALDRCYELEKGRSLIRQRFAAIILTIWVAVMMLGVMVLLPIATICKDWLIRQGVPHFPGAIVLFDIARWILSLVLMALVLCLLYYKGPAIRHRFRLFTPGAAFAMVVWVVLGLAFRLYLNFIGGKSYSQTYGTVGGVAILLLFFYIDALVLLLGAQINAEVDFEVLRVRRGSSDFRKAEDFSDGAPTGC